MDTKALRQKILDLAIRGKLVPQDPNDEPASVLLERIREQKKQMVKEGKLKPKDIKNDTIIFKGEDSLHYEKFADDSVKCIEDEIPFELPEGWAWARIFSLTSDLPYGTAKKSTSTGKVAVLRMGNIQNGEIDYSDLVFSSDENDIKKYKLLTGDLLFNRTNSAEWVGKTALYRGNIPAIYAGYLIRLRTSLCAEYLNAVMNSAYAKDYCNKVKTDGVNQSNINAQKLGHFVIPVPPQDEQERIALRIQQLLPIILNIQNERNDIIELIQKTKSKILDLAICGQLVAQDPNDEPTSVLLKRIRAEKEKFIKAGKIKPDKRESFIFKGEDNSYYETIGKNTICIDDEISFDLPNGWEWVRFSTITINRDNERSPISALNRTNISKIYDYYGASGKIDKIDNYIFNERLLLIGEDGANLVTRNKPIAFFADGKYWVNNHAHCIDSTDKFILEYLHVYINSINLEKYVTGSAQPKMTQDNMNSILIPFPPYAEQYRITEKLNIVCTIIDSILQ